MNKLQSWALAAVLILGTPAAFSGGHEGKGHNPMDGVDRMSRYLDLSEEQEDQLLELRQEREKAMLERRQEMRALRDSGAEVDRDAMKAEMEANRAETDAAIQNILTDEQWVKFEEKRAEMKEYRGKRREEGEWGDNDA